MLDLSGHGDQHSAGRFRPEDQEINGFLEAIVTAIPKAVAQIGIGLFQRVA
jgi:hypothetical protein